MSMGIIALRITENTIERESIFEVTVLLSTYTTFKALLLLPVTGSVDVCISADNTFGFLTAKYSSIYKPPLSLSGEIACSINSLYVAFSLFLTKRD